MARCRVYEKLDEAFHFLCVIATAALLIWCCIEYSKNDDLVQISFKKFGLGNEMTYPDISMCVETPDMFSRNELDRSRVDVEDYKGFLQGLFWNTSLSMLDYDNVTWLLKDSLIEKPYVMRSGSVLKNKINDFYTFGNGDYKCSTVRIPKAEEKHSNILSVTIPIKRSVFPAREIPLRSFRLRLHYPNQILRSWQFDYSDWPNMGKSYPDSFQIEINIRDMEIFNKRNKRNKPCIGDNSYDHHIISDILTKAACVPPYFRNMSTSPPCSTMNAMKDINEATSNFFYQPRQPKKAKIPCKQIVKIGADFDMKRIAGWRCGINGGDGE